MFKEITAYGKIFRVCQYHYPSLAVSEDGDIIDANLGTIKVPSDWRNIKYKTTSARHINGKILPVPFHRAVALYWVKNPDPSTKTHVNHMNFNKHDNRACNLEWVTHEENMNHYRVSKPMKKLKKDIIKKIFMNGTGFETPKQVAIKTGFSYSYVRKIFNDNLGRQF